MTMRIRQGQDAYTISNFRGGVKGRRLFGEAWVSNAFDTQYIPLAFPSGRRPDSSAKWAPRGRSASGWA